MKELRLLLALGQIAPKYAQEAAAAKPRRRWTKALAAAAYLALVVSTAGMFIDRLGLFRAGCSAWPGDFVEGRYYYTVQHRGLYCWDGETIEKVLGALWYDGKLVNDYGVYYTRGRSLWVKPHDTGKSKKLYTAPLLDCSHIGFRFYGEDVVVRLYNKWKEYASEVLLDGETGQFLAEVTPQIPYSDLYDNLTYSDTHFLVGERKLVLQPGDDEYSFVLTENGQLLLPEGQTVSVYANRYGEELWFDVRDGDDGQRTVYIARPNGEDTLLKSTCNYSGSVAGGYAYWVENEPDEVWCMDTRTGESWPLATDAEMEFYELSTDGVHLVSCVPWDDYQALWQVDYDTEGRPVGLTLADRDITD